MPEFHLDTSPITRDTRFPICLQVTGVTGDEVATASALFRERGTGSLAQYIPSEKGESGFVSLWFQTAREATDFIDQLREHAIVPDNQRSVSQKMRWLHYHAAENYR